MPRLVPESHRSSAGHFTGRSTGLVLDPPSILEKFIPILPRRILLVGYPLDHPYQKNYPQYLLALKNLLV